MAKFVDVGYLGAKSVYNKDEKKFEKNENGGPVFEKDDQGRMKYVVKFSDDVEVTINGKVVKSIYFGNKISKLEASIAKAGDEGDEEKIESLEKTKKRFEKDGDLSFIKHDGFAVFDD